VLRWQIKADGGATAGQRWCKSAAMQLIGGGACWDQFDPPPAPGARGCGRSKGRACFSLCEDRGRVDEAPIASLRATLFAY
jgi:hypothetical protein